MGLDGGGVLIGEEVSKERALDRTRVLLAWPFLFRWERHYVQWLHMAQRTSFEAAQWDLPT